LTQFDQPTKIPKEVIPKLEFVETALLFPKQTILDTPSEKPQIPPHDLLGITVSETLKLVAGIKHRKAIVLINNGSVTPQIQLNVPYIFFSRCGPSYEKMYLHSCIILDHD
jgi:hypothetical protein